MPLSIVYDIATAVMNWYVLIFERLRQEATHYKKKNNVKTTLFNRSWKWILCRKTALKSKRLLFNMMILRLKQLWRAITPSIRRLWRSLSRLGCRCDSKSCYHHKTLGVAILIPVSWLHCPPESLPSQSSLAPCLFKECCSGPYRDHLQLFQAPWK